MKKLFFAVILFLASSGITFSKPVTNSSGNEKIAARLASDRDFAKLLIFKLDLARKVKATHSQELMEKWAGKQITPEEKALLAADMQYKDVREMEMAMTANSKYMKNILKKYTELRDKAIAEKIYTSAFQRAIKSKKLAAAFFDQGKCYAVWGAWIASCGALYAYMIDNGATEGEAIAAWGACMTAADVYLLSCL